MRAEGIHKTFYILLIPELRNRCKSKPSGTGGKSLLQRSVDIWLQLRGAFLIQDEYPVKICCPIGSEWGRATLAKGTINKDVLLGEAFNNLHVTSVQIGLALDLRTALMSCSGFRSQRRRKERGTPAFIFKECKSSYLMAALRLIQGFHIKMCDLFPWDRSCALPDYCHSTGCTSPFLRFCSGFHPRSSFSPICRCAVPQVSHKSFASQFGFCLVRFVFQREQL